jgi:cobalt-zinc-cadmium efflux system membrane fusion protein
MSQRSVLTCCSCLLALLSLLGCSEKSSSGAPAAPMQVDVKGQIQVPADSPLRSRLKLQQLSARQQPQWLDAPAVVQADPASTVSVLPPAAGRVVSLKVGLGESVHRGQLLLEIASGDAAQASSDAAKARAALELADAALARAKTVLAAGGAAGKDLQSAQNDDAQARAEWQRAQGRLAALGGGSAAGLVQVTAPIDGIVTTLSTAAGSFANDPTTPLLSLARLDPIWVEAKLSEDQLGRVAVGQAASITLAAYPQRHWQGQVGVIGAVLDPDSRSDSVRIALANPDGALKPNMYASACIAVAMPATVFVPQSALLMNNDSLSVFVQVAPWTFVRRAVTVADDEGADVRVVSGLAAGDTVVASGGVLLND